MPTIRTSALALVGAVTLASGLVLAQTNRPGEYPRGEKPSPMMNFFVTSVPVGDGGNLGAPMALPDFSAFGPVGREPLSRFRRTVARNMATSAAEIPQVTLFHTADLTAVEAVRRGLRAAFSRASVPTVPRRRGSGHAINRLTGRAITGPSTVAVPPITTATKNRIDCWNTSIFPAFAEPSIRTDNEPATPAYAALIANAVTLTRAVSIPRVDAAAS